MVEKVFLFRPGTGNYLTMIISKEIRNLIHPLNDNPKHYLDLDYKKVYEAVKEEAIV